MVKSPPVTIEFYIEAHNTLRVAGVFDVTVKTEGPAGDRTRRAAVLATQLRHAIRKVLAQRAAQRERVEGRS